MVSIAANWKCMRCMNCFFMHADNEVALSYSLLLECMKLICLHYVCTLLFVHMSTHADNEVAPWC